jgi:hypothetical protein
MQNVTADNTAPLKENIYHGGTETRRATLKSKPQHKKQIGTE